MVVLQAFPVLAVVVAAYNFVVVLGSRAVGDVLRQVTLPSGDVWPITVGDVLIGTAIVLVLIEFASLGSGRASVVNHALSAIVFVICVVELLFIRGCGTAEFAVITLIVALDVVAGYSLTARLARRNLERSLYPRSVRQAVAGEPEVRGSILRKAVRIGPDRAILVQGGPRGFEDEAAQHACDDRWSR